MFIYLAVLNVHVFSSVKEKDGTQNIGSSMKDDKISKVIWLKIFFIKVLNFFEFSTKDANLISIFLKLK